MFKYYFHPTPKFTLMKQLFPTRIAEILFALAILAFGVMHLQYGKAGSGVPAYMPGHPSIWIYVTGVAFILAAVAIVINKYKRLACYLLALMIVILILTVRLQPALNQGLLERPLLDGAIAMAAIIIGNSSSK